MAFTSLSERLQETFKKLRGKGRLTEADVNEALREVRMALLEADVSFKVVRDFVNTIRQQAIGQDVMSSLTPAQHVVKIVHGELTRLMGGENAKIELASRPPTVIMLVGLQGSGKTTSCAKLANLFKKQGRRCLLVACDIYRPAAIKQLQVLGEKLEVPVFTLGGSSAADIAGGAVEQARKGGQDIVIVDTAGRLHINEELMQELSDVKTAVQPHEILLVVDAMTGQDAVTVAEAFNQRLNISGVVLTKLDGDTRGGAALSVRAVTGRPIKFAGIGEKLDAFEPFHPQRMADRILGMGDMMTLIEKAQASIGAEEAARLQQKLKSADFNLDDFLEHLRQFKKLGPIDEILAMIPGFSGMNKKLRDQMQFDERDLAQAEAILSSMTPWERLHPERIDGSRRRRVARGSATAIQDVNRLLKQFEQTKKMFRQFNEMQKAAKGKGKGKIRMPKFPFM